MKKQKGFTLVELLVVIAIIGILAAILLPSLGGAKTRALRAKAQSTITQLAQAIKAYQMDWGVYIPDGQGDISTEDDDEEQKATKYGYTATSLVAYLDGDEETYDSNSGGSSSKKIGRVQYYEFSPKELYYPTAGDTKKNIILIDPFGSYYMYHNFANESGTTKTKLYTKTISTSNPMHPGYTKINFRSFQIYTEANYPGDPYGQKFDSDVKKNEDTFKWITNYSN